MYLLLPPLKVRVIGTGLGSAPCVYTRSGPFLHPSEQQGMGITAWKTPLLRLILRQAPGSQVGAL